MTLNLPARIQTVAELDEVLSRPSPATIECVRRLDADVMILGSSGKMGPTVARLARRAMEAAAVQHKVYAVARSAQPELQAEGIETIQCDLLDLEAVRALPRVENVIYMVGRKFGSTGSEHLTWAINVGAARNTADVFREPAQPVQAAGQSCTPDRVHDHERHRTTAKRLHRCRIVVYSTGCVYPLVNVTEGGCCEDTPPDPIGEYANSCLGRERMFDYAAEVYGTRVLHFRLNYAVELRYGVLYDIARQVWAGEEIDVTTGYANVIWQGDACNQTLQCLEHASSPATVLNITGPETITIRQVANRFGELLGRPAHIVGQENGRAYLSNAAKSHGLFGYPTVPLDRVLQWIAHWISTGGESLNKPTHFETQDGKY